MKDIKIIRLLLLFVVAIIILVSTTLYFLIQNSSIQDVPIHMLSSVLLGSFWTGLFDGFMSPCLLILSLFVVDNFVYNVDMVDNATNYNFGFIIGLVLLIIMFLKK